MEKQYEIVIARYKENLDWLNFVKKENVRIYNKGVDDINIGNVYIKNRPNKGREAETFFYYIITNYDKLPEYVFFLQGNPFDHMLNTHVNSNNIQYYFDLLYYSNPKKTIPILSLMWPEEHGHYPSLKTREYFSFFFSSRIPIICEFSPGCQYMIPREYILKNTLECYKKIHAMTINGDIFNPINNYEAYKKYDFDQYGIIGWIIERMFPYFFGDVKAKSSLSKKRYLIAGSSKKISLPLIHSLLLKNYEVIIIDNVLKYDEIKDKIHLLNYEITNESLLKSGYVDGIYYITTFQNNSIIKNIYDYSNSFDEPIKVLIVEDKEYLISNDELSTKLLETMEN